MMFFREKLTVIVKQQEIHLKLDLEANMLIAGEGLFQY